jgi:hypothetical protein
MAVEKFSLPETFNVRVIVLYKGKEISKNFLDENPDIKIMYINQSDFMIEYLSLKDNTSKGRMSVLEITENGIKRHINILPL